MDKENADGGEDGEELEEEEEEEEETGADPRRSLQFSELLPLKTFAVCAAHDWEGGCREKTWWCRHSFFYTAASWAGLMV